MQGQTELTKSKDQDSSLYGYQTYSSNQLQNSKALLSMEKTGAFSSDGNNDSNPSRQAHPRQ